MPVGPLPSPGPFGRIVDVRVWPHGFSSEQGDIVRPNIEDAAWHAGAGKWGGNIVWTGSTVRHTVAYNGPRGRYFGPLSAGSFSAMKGWFSHNGAKVDAPGGLVLAACVKTYDSLPTSQTYAGTGDGTLDVQTPSTAAGALTGDYEVRCIEAAPVPRFLVTGPDAQPIGVAEAGPLLGAPVLFDGVVRFTLHAGAIAFVVGDAWTLTVEEAEQFVIITVPFVDAIPLTETLWRRGVSLTPGSAWRQLATIAPVSGQVDGSIQPWFFNASATRAVTCRGLGEDGGGVTLGTVGRSLNVDTLGVTDTVETSTPPIYITTRVVNAVHPPGSAHEGDASDVTLTNSTPSADPVAQLVALDYAADALVRVEIEISGSCVGTGHMWVLPDDPSWSGTGDFNDNQYENVISGAYSAQVDVVWSVGGAEATRLTAFSVSASGSYVETWFDVGLRTADISELFDHRVMLDAADPRADRVAMTQYSGTVSSEWQADEVSGAYQQTASGVSLQHIVGGTVVADAAGGSGSSAISTNPGQWAMVPVWPGTEPDPGPPASSPIIGIRRLGAQWLAVKFVIDPMPGGSGVVNITDSMLPAANTGTGRGLQTSAQDTRGNWLMTAEVAAFGTSDMRWPGSISGSGTYTTQAGGPDALTPSLVATLTGYAPHDRWDVGAF